MKNLLVLALAAPLVLMGCNSSSSGGGGGGSSTATLSGLHTSSKSATFVINNENRYLVDDASLEAAGSALFFGGFWGGGLDLLSMPSRLMENKSTRGLEGRSLARMNFSDTESCDNGGSVSYSMSSTGISNAGDMSSSGSLTIETIANNCGELSFGYEEVENGTMRITFKWSGFNESAETFDRISLAIETINYSSAEYDEGGELVYLEESDGSIAMVMTRSSYSIAFSMVLSNMELDGESIKLQTLSNIGGGNDDDYPTSGEWEVLGASSTKVNYKVEPNGILVTVNDGSSELIEWNDFY